MKHMFSFVYWQNVRKNTPYALRGAFSKNVIRGMAVFAFPPAHCLDRFSSQAVTPGRRIMFKRRFIITQQTSAVWAPRRVP